jgi:UPF0755 protein
VRKLFWLIFVALLAAAGWFAWAIFTPTEPPGQTFVLLHPGYSSRRIAAELKSAGIIRSEQAFILWHYVHRHRSLKAGEYLFEKPDNIINIQKRLLRGDVYFHTVVVPEGFTMFDIARAIEAAGLGPAQDVLKVAQSDTDMIADMAPHAKSLEGYLFPDTYDFTRMMPMRQIAGVMVCNFRREADRIGLDRRAVVVIGQPPEPKASNGCAPSEVIPGVPDDLTPLERTVIMASIVEKETRVPDERPLVASVYYNRLGNHIALDADPSIIYAELLAGTYTGALHHADMQFQSPYNTYRNPGLPPGPIANPGRSSLEAAMQPAQSDYYYFVADAEGHHRFAHSIEEHNENVAAYRKAMRNR